VFGGIFRSGGACGAVEMPADSFAVVFHLDGEIAVHRSFVEAIVADGPIAVEGEFFDVHDENVAGHGAGDEERTCLRVAADRAIDALEVFAAGVDGGGVDGVSGFDGKDGFVERGDLAVEDGRGELVALRRRVLDRGSGCCGELDGERVGFVVNVGLDVGGFDGAIGDGAGDLVGIVLLVLGGEVEGGAVESAREFIAAVGCGEFVAGLLDVETVVERGAEVVD
jgi:hypothetical protein